MQLVTQEITENINLLKGFLSVRPVRILSS